VKVPEKSLPLKHPGGDPSTPRALLEKGSLDWCYRTVDRLKWAFEKKSITEFEFNKILDDLSLYEAWTKVPEGHPYGSREAMLRAEIGLTVDEAQAQIRATVKEARDNPMLTQEELAEKRSEWGQEGGRGKKNLGSRTTKVSAERGASYLARRLQRDHPAIFARLEAGEFPSVRAAAREAGIVKDRITILTEPQAAATQIRRHFDPESLRELARLLSES
jgi:hypothetical protein